MYFEVSGDDFVADLIGLAMVLVNVGSYAILCMYFRLLGYFRATTIKRYFYDDRD